MDHIHDMRMHVFCAKSRQDQLSKSMEDEMPILKYRNCRVSKVPIDVVDAAHLFVFRGCFHARTCPRVLRVTPSRADQFYAVRQQAVGDNHRACFFSYVIRLHHLDQDHSCDHAHRH